MNAGTNKFAPDYDCSPGEILADCLADLGMSQAELARRTGLSVKHINQIAQGQASLTAGTAVLLERATGVDARVWSQLESNFQLAKVRDAESKRLENDVSWLSRFPIAELKRRGFIQTSRSGAQQLRELLDFFRVASPSAWDQVWATPTAYRLSQTFDPDFGALATWIRIGELKLSDRPKLPPFDRDKFRSALSEVREITKLEDADVAVAQLVELCAHAGVAVVVEREIKGARINGAVRWLASGNPLIILSMRHRWSDIFWFTFFHEAGHILIHGQKRLTFVDTPQAGARSSVAEVEADNFASTALVPEHFDAEIRRARDATEIQGLAEKIGVHSGVIVGRLQHEGLIRFNQLNELRVRFQPGD